MSDRLFASWLVTERCNFRCSYCWIFKPHTRRKRFLRNFKKLVTHRKWPLPKYDIARHLDDIIDRFKKTGREVTFGFTGGEPLVYPGILEIMSRLAEHDEFMLALDTNLAIGDVGRLMNAVPPEKMEYIFASLHAAERERLYGSYDKFIDDVLTLREGGYNIGVSYPLPPYHYDRFRADIEYCESRGIKPILRMFSGWHEGKFYPEAYSEEELQDIFLGLSPEYNRERANRGTLYGRRCNAGIDLVRVRCNGDVIPCLHDYTLLGNVFSELELRKDPVVCRSPYCGAWSYETLFGESGELPEIEDIPPMTFMERQRQTFNQFKGWWQGD